MRAISVFVVLTLITSVAVATWLVRVGDALDRPLTLPSEGATYVVHPGDNLRGVAEVLATKGWLTDPHHLALWGRWTGEAQRIKAGEFRIAPGTSPRALLALLVRGETVQHAVTLVEGWTFKQVISALHQHPHISRTINLSQLPETLAALGLRDVAPEGYLLPDTYHFTRGTSDRAIVKRAHAAMRSYLTEQWDGRANGLPLKAPYEALVLASIIEKETGLATERARISGVFIRRLERGMRLETDPTVIYGLGDSFSGNLKRKHLRQATPYNTYLIKGLPPTPIAMPGREAVHAALHPAAGADFFFVGRGDGSHFFSPSLAEHSRAVDKYQRKRKRPARAE